MNNNKIYYTDGGQGPLKIVIEITSQFRGDAIEYAIKNSAGQFWTENSNLISNDQWYDAKEVEYSEKTISFLIPVEFDDIIRDSGELNITISLRKKDENNTIDGVLSWNPEREPTPKSDPGTDTDQAPSIEAAKLSLRVTRGSKSDALDLRPPNGVETDNSSYTFKLLDKSSRAKQGPLPLETADQKGEADIKDDHKFIYHAGKKQQHGEKVYYVMLNKGKRRTGIVEIKLTIDWRPWLLVAAILVPLLALLTWLLWPVSLKAVDDESVAIKGGETITFKPLKNDIYERSTKPVEMEIIKQPEHLKVEQNGNDLQVSAPEDILDTFDSLDYKLKQDGKDSEARISFVISPFILEDDIAEALPGQRITLLLLENDTLPGGTPKISHDDPLEGTASVDSDSGKLSYRAPPEDIDQIKTIVFPYQVEIDGRSETADIEITIKPPLQLEDDEVTITPGREATVTVLDNDVYPRGEQVYVSIPNKPPGIISASDNRDNSVTVRLAEDAPADYRFDLKYNVTYKNITRTANIIIKTPVEVIRARDDQVTVYPGETRRLRVVDNDDLPGPGNVWALSVSQQPRRGTARTSGDEHIDITLNNVQPGDTDTFTYDLSFENQTDSARVSINVAEPLIARNDILTLTGQTRAGAIDVLNNDDLPRGGRPRVEISSQGQYGEAEPRSRGNIRYKLDQTHDRAIEDSVTYQVTVGDQVKTAKIKVIYKPAPPPQCPRDEQWGEMFLVPAGTYEINDNPRVRQAARDLGINTRFKIPRNFCIQLTEVSGDEFKEFANVLGQDERRNIEYFYRNDEPVIKIQQGIAIRYAKWLENLTNKYRVSLPTRREWLAAFYHTDKEGLSAGFRSLDYNEVREWSSESCKLPDANAYYALGKAKSKSAKFAHLDPGYKLCRSGERASEQIGFRVVAKKK